MTHVDFDLHNYLDPAPEIEDSVVCKACFGSGEDEKAELCGDCGGLGLVDARCFLCDGCDGLGYTETQKTCPCCDGDGWIEIPQAQQTFLGER